MFYNERYEETFLFQLESCWYRASRCSWLGVVARTGPSILASLYP